jgi:Holliday junction resolvase-like predicted endonuclease
VAAAELWLQKNDPAGKYNCRFDVIGYTGDKVQWIKNAFDYR